MNIQGFIETNDSALIMIDYQGLRTFYRSVPGIVQARVRAIEKTKFRRQVVGFARHVTSSEKYRWLNDAACAVSGEVRAPMGVPRDQIKQADVKLVFDVAEIVWESPSE